MSGTQTSKSNQQLPVTWLLSVKNSLPFLQQTLESIYSQTYRNQKLLVWDDCSIDGTLDELQRWIPHRIPGKIFSGRSLRLGASLAFLVEQADTELCARIDGDDVSLPQRLELQVEFMQAHPEVGVLGTRTLFIDEHGQPCDKWDVASTDAEIRWRSRWQPQLCHPSVLFRKSVIMKAGNYRDFQIEDLDLWMRLSNITQIRNLDQVLLHYRRFENSMTGKVLDFVALDRKTATLNSSILFPNMSDSARIMKLWEATHPSLLHRQPELRKLPVILRSLDDRRFIKEFEGAALSLARQTGQPDNYFSSTELFKHQHYHLRRHLFHRAGLGKLHALRARMASSSEAIEQTA